MVQPSQRPKTFTWHCTFEAHLGPKGRIVKKVRADTIPFHCNLRLWDLYHSRWFLTNQKIWAHNQMLPWKFLLQHLIKRSAVTTVLNFRVYNWHLFAQATSLMIALCMKLESHLPFTSCLSPRALFTVYPFVMYIYIMRLTSADMPKFTFQ